MKKDETLLGELVASSDNPQTLRAQLVDATVVRPDALQQIERTVLIARNSGAVDEAAATRILVQVDLLVEATRMFGIEPTRLREVPGKALEDFAATLVRSPPTAIDPTRQRTAYASSAPAMPGDERTAYAASAPAAPTDERTAYASSAAPASTQRLDHAPTQRLDHPPTQRLDYPATQRIDHPPTQRLDHPPTQRLDQVATQPDHPPTQRLDRGGKTQAIPAQAAAVAAAAAAATVLDSPATARAPGSAPPSSAAPSGLSNAPTVASVKRSDAITLVAGVVLKDRFVLTREIGRGGMGAVFAAEDLRKVEANDPEPMVAVKVLAPDFARHPVAFVALQRESRRAQSLAHPNIATVFDFDRDGDLVLHDHGAAQRPAAGPGDPRHRGQGAAAPEGVAPSSSTSRAAWPMPIARAWCMRTSSPATSSSPMRACPRCSTSASRAPCPATPWRRRTASMPARSARTRRRMPPAR